MIGAIKSGIRSPTMAAELECLERRKSALQKDLDAPPAPLRLHPNLAETDRRKVGSLHEALNEDGTRGAAAAILRDMIDEERLIPKDGDLAIYFVGNLAAILELCAKKNPGAVRAEVRVTLVAGARNRLYLLFVVRGLQNPS